MAYPVAERTNLTVEEYFDLEKRSEIRHEFFRGEIFAVAGMTRNHNRITRNTANALDAHFLLKGCEVVSENVKLEVLRHEYYPYPDVVLMCSKFETSPYVIRFPSLIVEVLSKSTAEYDRTTKFRHYKKLTSLQHYMLVSQYECFVELYSRVEGSDLWLYATYEQPDDIIEFDKIDFRLPVSTVYENITFVAPGDED